MFWLLSCLLLCAQSPAAFRSPRGESGRFFVTTTDSAGLSRWLRSHRMGFRPVRLGRFEVTALPDSLDGLDEVPGVVGVEPIRRQRTQDLDASRTLIRAEPVHLGTGLKHAHHGTGSIVGVVDNGFDLTHPAFLDSAGNSRILRLWDHTATGGTPPSGFTSGSLFSGSAIAALGHSGTLIHHGTHVTGLAAARAVEGSGGEWWGVADDARLVLVECGSGCTDLDEGIEYIYQVADSLGLPAVVNVSWGNHQGPRDGLGSDCVLLGSLLGPGKLATASAGNSGAYTGHAVHVFSGSQDTARLATETVSGAQTDAAGDTVRLVGYGKVELWGDSGATFKAWAEFLDTAGNLLATSTAQTAGKSSWKSISLSKVVGNDTFWVEGDVERRNGKGGMNLVAYSSRTAVRLRIGVTASSGTVHGWTVEDGRAFLADTGCATCVIPDHDHMLSDKSTCPLQIAVGAVDEAGSEAWFTSRGPGLAKNPKPDISAPGVEVVSTLNSSAGSWPVSGSWNGYSWGAMSGTSMSTPLVTGALALLLEQNPSLTTDSALSLLKGSATTHDAGIGWGVLDVERMLLALDSAAAVGVAVRHPTNAAGLEREWITPEGRRIAVPAGTDPRRCHPGGIAWLRSCGTGGCTTQGIVRP